MNEERFLEIMNDEDIGGVGLMAEKGCNAVKGLLIIQKYLPLKGIEAANHDVIYSANVADLIKAGITEDDAIELRRQNWMTEDDSYLACFV